MANFQADSKNGLDLGDLRPQVPMKKADAEGRATWVQAAPPRWVLLRSRLIQTHIGVNASGKNASPSARRFVSALMLLVLVPLQW